MARLSRDTPEGHALSSDQYPREPVEIVRVTPADVPEVAPLFDAYRMFYSKQSDVAAGEAFLRERLSRDESVVLLARLDGRCVGFCQLYPIFSSVALTRRWVLNDLFVGESARRRGVAKALLDAAVMHARESGADKLELKTERANVGAKALYEREGWELDEVFLRYTKGISDSP